MTASTPLPLDRRPRLRAKLLLPALVCVLAPVAARATAQESLLIRPLRDAGGAPAGLNGRLGSALERYIAGHADRAVVVSHPPKAADTGSTGYVLEGDVSYAAGGDDDSGRFLVTARLFRGGVRRTLIGQWAGSAASLRLLTVNLRQDPSINTFGLVGELGSRIIVAIAGDAAGAAGRLTRLTARLPRVDGSRPTLIGAADRPQASGPIGPRSRVRLRCPQASGERVFHLLFATAAGVVHLGPLGHNTPSLEAPAGRSVVSEPVTVPDDAVEAWIVWTAASGSARRAGPRAGPRLASYSADATSVAPTNGLHPPRRAGGTTDGAALPFVAPPCRSVATPIVWTRGAPGGDGELPAVQVLDGVGHGRPTPDPEVERLLAEMNREPERWRAVRLRCGTERDQQ